MIEIRENRALLGDLFIVAHNSIEMDSKVKRHLKT